MTNRLNPGEVLERGQQLVSDNGRYIFWHQDDGNLVLYFTSKAGAHIEFKHALWNSETANRYDKTKLIMQHDGNLMLLGPADTYVWSSNSVYNPGAYLTLQDDGNLVIYDLDRRAIWHTNTWVPLVGNNGLAPGEMLSRGYKKTSNNGRYVLTMQEDFNCVLYIMGNGPLWNTWDASNRGGGGLPVTHVIMQQDGNFVAYNADSASWDSGTWGHPGSVLVVQDDGNMVVYAPGGNAVWNSHTNQ